MGPRPTGITILAALNAIGGFWTMWTGTMYLGMGIAALFTVDKGSVGGYASLYGIVLIVVGLVLLFVAAGYYGVQAWAWLYGLVINSIALVLGILSSIFAGLHWAPLVGVVIHAIVLFYLTRPSTRAAFGR